MCAGICSIRVEQSGKPLLGCEECIYNICKKKKNKNSHKKKPSDKVNTQIRTRGANGIQGKRRITLIAEKDKTAKILDCEPTRRLEKSEGKMLDGIIRGR